MDARPALQVLRPKEFSPRNHSRLRAGASLMLRRGDATWRYALDGWVEYLSRGGGALLDVMNIRGVLHGPAEGAPAVLHLCLEAETVFDSAHANAASLALTYTELARETPDHVEGSDVCGAVEPVIFPCTLRLSQDEDGGIVELAGGGEVPELPGYDKQDGDVWQCDLTAPGDPVKGNVCIQICLSVKVRKTSNKVLQSRQQVDDLMARVDKIWSCPGQCCIKFVVRSFELVDDLPAKIDTADGAKKKDSVTTTHKDACYDVYFIDELGLGYGGLGVTDLTHEGSVVGLNEGAKERTLDELSDTLAHELGHALNLANDSDPKPSDPKGVKAHSTVKDNLMGAGKDRSKLNAEQCKQARQSVLAHKGVELDSCSEAPSEV